MPRTKGIPSYCLHRPSGQARVRINGKDDYLGPHGSAESKRRYEQVVRRLIADPAKDEMRARVEVATDLTVSELIVRYLGFVDGYYTSNEPANFRHALSPLRRLYGSEAVVGFGPLKLKSVRQQFIAAGPCRNEINKRVRRIVRLFKWGVGEELVPASVHHALKAVERLRKGRGGIRESEPVNPIPDARVDAIRPFVSRQVWATIELQRLTGMRPGEVCMMRADDINTARRIWEYVPMEHKTEHHDKDRTIFIGPQAQQVLRPWLRTELAAFLFQPREAEAERRRVQRTARKSKVQPSQRDRRKARPSKAPGKCYDLDSYRRAIDSACDRAFPHPTLEGIPKDQLTDGQAAELKAWRRAHRRHPHQLRHNAATRLRRELGLDVARAVLGRSTPVVTEIYAELDRRKAADVMEKIG